MASHTGVFGGVCFQLARNMVARWKLAPLIVRAILIGGVVAFTGGADSSHANEQTANVPWPTDVWPTATPESQGVSSRALQDAVLLASPEIGTAIIIKNGYDIWQYGNPYPTGDITNVPANQVNHFKYSWWASCQRSYLTTLFGIAIKENVIPGGKAALGRNGGAIFVCPSLNLVVARQGKPVSQDGDDFMKIAGYFGPIVDAIAGVKPKSIVYEGAAVFSSGPAEVSTLGIDKSKLAVAMQRLADNAEGKPYGMIVIRDGKKAVELYGSGASNESRWEIGSLRKAVGSSLLGMVIAEGKVKLDDLAYEIWPDIFTLTRQEKDKRIQVAQLFNSTSGWKRDEQPGTEWVYNNPAFAAGGKLIGRLYQQPNDETAALAIERIGKPIGAQSWHAYHFLDSFGQTDGNPGPTLAIESNLRDLAKFGYLWLRQGQWDGEQIIPKAHVTRATQNQTAHLGNHYGLCWFVNDEKALLPDVPEDAFYHIGNGKDRRRTLLAVIPSLDTVVAVSVHQSVYDITKGYRNVPVSPINDLLAPIVDAIRAPSDDFYFPPAGEGIANQSRQFPEMLGLSPKIVDELNSLIASQPESQRGKRWALWRHGHLAHVEGDFNTAIDVASLRKTWHAMIVGAAIKQGKIPSYRQKLSEWNEGLVGHDADASSWHVITQSAGFDYPYADHPDYKPGEMWTYSDWNPIQLCNALARVYGKTDFTDHYEDVAGEAYFNAIGMRGWSTSLKAGPKDGPGPDGVRFVLSLEHMGRLGLFALARGSWEGAELVPRWFVEELETKQTYGMKVNYNGPFDGRIEQLNESEFPECPYGYMTWVNTDGDFYPGADTAWAWGWGAGGTTILWNRNNGIVFAGVGMQPDPSGHGVPHIIEANVKGPNPLSVSM